MNFLGKTSTIALVASLACLSPALHAQETADPDPEAEAEAESRDVAVLPPQDDGSAIVVYGTRLKGQLNIDTPPLAEYGEEDIAAFGAGSIADIIAAIEPVTSSGARGSRGGGRPIFLINGIRTSSWREFRSYPPEAVAKVEVFTEEVAQRFGYSADQRVVNIVLKPNFSSVTAEAEYEQPAEGGYSRNEQDLTYLKIGEKGRLNFNLDIEDRSMLTEAERGLTVEEQPGAEEFRSLIADTWSGEATANYARAFMETGTSLSLNATLGREESRSLSGLADNGVDPLARNGRTDTVSLGATINKPMGDWNANFTSDAVYANGRTLIDRRDASGVDTARTKTTTIVNKATLNGFPIDLPAGEVSATFDLGLDWKRYSSEDTRADEDLEATRRRLSAGTNISVPVAESGGFLGAVGSVRLNLGGGVEDLSDFGTLANWTAGVNWAPFDNLDISATRIWREVAPGISDLANPRVEEYNVSVYDYATGQNALVTYITGGNPDLVAETQADWKFGINWELPFWENTRLQADYGINRSRNVTTTPGFSSAFEDAFPDRVTRGAEGELLAIDRRPLTLYQTRSRILSFGINTRGEIGKEPEQQEGRGQGRERGAPPSGAREGEGRGPGGGFDPARMAAMREAFCKVPEGGTPDLSQIPEQFRARLLDDKGNPDPAKIAAARERFCGAEAEQRQQQFAAMRQALCAEPPQLDGLPAEMLARLKGEDGQIDPEKVKAARERMCAADGAQAQTEGGQGGGRRGGGGFGRMMGGGGNPNDTRPRYFLSFNHTINLENEVMLSEGGPVLDQLDGFLLGSGAISESSSRFEGGLFWQGYGFRLTGQYVGDAVVRGGDLPGSSDLFFGDLATFDVRLFADLGEVFKREDGWMKGLRLSLVADNVFDARRKVVDENGVTPEAYEKYRIDPTGRYLGIDIRKAF